MRRRRRTTSPRSSILDRLRAWLGRSPEPTAPEVFTARTPPTSSDVARGERVVPVDAPSVRVHPDRVERAGRRVELTPAQALELAREGTDALRRRRPSAR